MLDLMTVLTRYVSSKTTCVIDFSGCVPVNMLHMIVFLIFSTLQRSDKKFIFVVFIRHLTSVKVTLL